MFPYGMLAHPPTLTLAAPAKINLALSVGPPVAHGAKAGFHPIASWLVATTLHDDVVLTRLPNGAASRVIIEWAADAPKASPIDWPVERDLGFRAHRLLEAHIGHALPVEVVVRKRIPVGGGLGGGSSDGASVLIGLNRLFNLPLTSGELRLLSTRLGSDVAFFIDDDQHRRTPRPAMVTGFGELIERLSPVPPTPGVLLIPPVACPTGAVYRAFDAGAPGALREADVRAIIGGARGAGAIRPAVLFNDLASPACEAEPRLRVFWETLGRVGPRVHVTGSGSTMFALLPGALEGEVRATCAAFVGAAPEVLALPVELR